VILDLLKSGLNAVAPYLVQILIGAIIILVILTGIQTARLAWVKKDLRVAKAENDTFAAKIIAQNQAIRQWQAEGERAGQQAEQARQAAAKARADSNRKVARIRAEPVPAECGEAVRWAAGKAGDLAEGWQ
jgi:hypothetical protein